VDAVAEHLSEEIFDGIFLPGHALVESQLAKRYQVPRQTIRSALVVLIHNGILCREPNKSVYVPEFNESDLRDLFDVRRLLEMEAARILAIQKIVPKEAENVVRLMEILSDKSGWNEILRLDFDFHKAMIKATGSLRLQRFYHSISSEKRLALSYYYRSTNFSTPQKIAEEHMALINALRTGDPNTAMDATHHHLNDAEAFIKQAIQRRRDQVTC
tara:strand:- start:15388 stop:16032 length:645 start_codon:yes stop_codon:yes gene_type:complete